MKHNTIPKLGASLLVALGLSAAANAAAISGSIHFIGSADMKLGATNSTPALADNIVFVNPGYVGFGQTGDYSAITPIITQVTFTDFTFGTVGTLGPLLVNPLWTLSFGGETYSFRLESVTINQYSGSARLVEGYGVASITGGGFTDTGGHWELSTSGGDTTITFSSATDVVPDGGTTMALFGVSLLGLGAIRRKLLKL